MTFSRAIVIFFVSVFIAAIIGLPLREWRKQRHQLPPIRRWEKHERGEAD